MKILVTGPKGFVGSRIMDALHAVGAPPLREASEDDIRRIVDEAEPDVIIHTAAISDIPTCEQNPEASYRANVIINLYARHKLEMENRALALSPDTVLLRAAWMYDMPRYGVRNRHNFLMNMLREKELAFSATQRRGITYVREVAENMRAAASLPGGVYNYGSENTLTMLETAQWLKDELGLPVRLTDAGPRHNLWMDCAKLREQGISFRSTVDGLKRCLEDYAL